MPEAPLYDEAVKPYEAQVGGERVLPDVPAAPGTPGPVPSKGLVNVRSKMGEVMSLPLEELPQAEAMGYTLETKEQRAVREYSDETPDLLGGAKTALRGWADESSLGVGGVVEAKTGKSVLTPFEADDDFARAKHEYLAKKHPLANVLGRGAGIATSLLYGGPLFKGAGKVGGGAARLLGLGAESAAIATEAAAHAATPAAATAVKAAAPSIAKKLARGVVTGAVEGAALQAPVVITEASLGDPKAAAEAAVMGMGVGAVFGVMGPLAHEMFGSKTLGKASAAEHMATAAPMEHAADMEVLDSYSKLPAVATESPMSSHDYISPMSAHDYTAGLPGPKNDVTSFRSEVKEVVTDYLAEIRAKDPMAVEGGGLSPIHMPPENMHLPGETPEYGGSALMGPEVSPTLNAADSLLAGKHAYAPGDETLLGLGVPKIERPNPVRGAAEEVANEYTVRHIGPGKKGMRKIDEMPGGVQGVGEVGRKFGFHKAPASEHAAMFEKALDQVGSEKRSVIEPLNALEDGSPLRLFDPQELAARVDRNVGADVTAKWGHEAKARRIDQHVKSILEKGGEKLTAEQAWERVQHLDQLIYGEKVNLTADQILPELRKIRSVYKGYFNEVVTEAARIKGINPEEILGKIQTLDTEYSALSVLKDAAKNNAAAGGANSKLSLFAYISGGVGGFLGSVIGGPFAGVLGAAGGAGLNKLLREKGSGAVARLAESMIPQGIQSAGKAMGMVGVELDRLVPTLNMLAKGQTLPGKMPTTAHLIGAWLPKHLRTDDAQTNFARFQDRFTQLTSNPQAMAQKVDSVTAHFRDGAPGVADRAQAQITSVLNYISSRMPKPTEPDMPFSKAKQEPTKQSLADFGAVLQIAKDPHALLDHLGRKSLTKAHVETAKALWDKYYKALVDRTVRYSADPKAPTLPLSAKTSVGYLTGTAIDPSGQDKYKKAYAATFTKGGGGKPGPKGSPMKLPDSATAMDHLANKGMR